MSDLERAKDLAVVLHDLAWLLPRTIGLTAALADPLPLSELEIMRLLVRRPGLNVTEVAAELGLRSTNVSTGVRALVARGLLERQPDPDDRRVVRLVPTERATAAREAREDLWGRDTLEALGSISPEERSRLLEGVGALRALSERLARRDA